MAKGCWGVKGFLASRLECGVGEGCGKYAEWKTEADGPEENSSFSRRRFALLCACWKRKVAYANLRIRLSEVSRHF